MVAVALAVDGVVEDGVRGGDVGVVDKHADGQRSQTNAHFIYQASLALYVSRYCVKMQAVRVKNKMR
jgi:hypothetical protein